MKLFLSFSISTTISRCLCLLVLVFFLLPTAGFGQTWYRTNTGTKEDLNDTWGTDEDNIWVVGNNGTILNFNGIRWQQHRSGTTSNLYGIWGDNEDDIWAVGDGGTILYYNGRFWQTQTSGTTRLLRDVWGADTGDVLAVGDGGTILKFDGSDWVTQTSGTATSLRGIWGYSHNGIWAVGGDGTILKFNGSDWVTETSGTVKLLMGIWGSDENNIWAVAFDGSIHYFDGTWSQQKVSSRNFGYSIWGVDKDNIWMGNGGSDMYKGPGSWPSHYVDSRIGFLKFGTWGTNNASLILTVGNDGKAYFSNDQCIPTKWYKDFDKDKFGNKDSVKLSCVPLIGYASNKLDCNDSSVLINPLAYENCENSIDDDCDGLTDMADDDCKTMFTYSRTYGTDSLYLSAYQMYGQIFKTNRRGLLESIKLEDLPWFTGTTGGYTYASFYEVTSPGNMTFVTQTKLQSPSFTFRFDGPRAVRTLKANTEYIIFVIYTGASRNRILGTKNPTNLSADEKTVVLASPDRGPSTVNGFAINGVPIKTSPTPSFNFSTAPINFIMNYTVTMAPIE